MNELDRTPRDLSALVDAVLRSRRTIRAFKPDPLSRDEVLEILEVSASAPSNSNTQPWRVHVLTGEPKRTLSERLVEAFSRGDAPPPSHFPEPLPPAFSARQDDFAARYYASLGIARDDRQARTNQSLRNFLFFGAPVGLIFTIDKHLRAHSWLDLGLFIQTVMIAARARGLDTCPQVSFARFHAEIAQHLKLDAHELTVCGMSMGYADPQAPVNHINVPREKAPSFSRFVGFDESP